MKKKGLLTVWRSICLVLILVVLSFMAACAKPAPAPEPIVLKALQCFPLDHPNTYMYHELIDRVNEQAKGELKIDLLGGPEVVPTRDQVDTLRAGGVIDMLFTTAGYYESLVPESVILHVTTFASPMEERKAGFYDLMNKIHMKKGLYYLGRAIWVTPYHMWLNKPAQNLEGLVGLKIRSGGGIYNPFLEALDSVVVFVAFPEIYSALERGMVDGFIHPMSGPGDYGWLDITKYCLDHPIWVSSCPILLNLDAFNRLPKHLKDLLVEAQINLEPDIVAYWTNDLEKERQKVRELGVQFIELPPADAKRYVDTAYDCIWPYEEKIGGNPEDIAKLKKLLGK